MCNLYAVTKGQQGIRELTRAMVDRTGNLPPLPGKLSWRFHIAPRLLFHDGTPVTADTVKRVGEISCG